MKKFRMVFALALIATICAVFLTACGTSYSGDPEKDKKTLEDKGYDVTVTENGDVTYLSAMKMNLKLEDLADEDKIKDLKLESVSIVYYKDNDAAKKAYDEAKKALDGDGVPEAIKKATKVRLQDNMVISEATLTGKDAESMM